MHKKSVEASESLKGDDSMYDGEHSDTGDEHTTCLTANTNNTRDKQDLRSESIAVLRAKALEHNARIIHPDSRSHNLHDSHVTSMRHEELVNKDNINYKSKFEEPGSEVELTVV